MIIKRQKKCLKYSWLLPILFLGGLLFLTNTVKATIVEDDLKWYYQFESNGEDYITENEFSINGNGGVAVYSTSGVFDYKIDFNNNYLTYEDNLTGQSLTNDEPYSLSFWFNTNQSVNTNSSFISGNLASNQWGFSLRDGNKIRFDFYNANGWAILDTEIVGTLSDSEWHNVVVNFQFGNDFTDYYEVWVDGIEYTTSIVAGNPNGTVFSNYGNWATFIGAESGAGDRKLIGSIDDYAFFNKFLTETEIETLQTSSIIDIISGPPECTSYTYTDWGLCDGYYQARNWITKTPSNCEGGIEPVLYQSCSLGEDYRVIHTIKPIYYISTTASNLIKYVYDNQGEGLVSVGDYINIYKVAVGQELEEPAVFIASSTIIDLNNILKKNGNSYFVLTGTSTDYVDSQFTYYDIVPVLGGETYASTTFPIYWVNDNDYFFEENYFTNYGSESTGTSTAPDVSTMLFQTNLANYICTEEEWASGNWFIYTKCRAIYWPISIFAIIGDSVGNIVRSEIFKIKDIFPLNIYLNIRNSWINSASKEIPSAFNAFTIIDESGNISVALPNEWVASGTPEIQLWGPQIFEEHESLKLLFGAIRSLSTYIMWLAYIFGLWKLGEKALEEFFNEETEEETIKIK